MIDQAEMKKFRREREREKKIVSHRRLNLVDCQSRKKNIFYMAKDRSFFLSVAFR